MHTCEVCGKSLPDGSEYECVEHGTFSCGDDTCICPSCPEWNPVIILETARASVPNLRECQSLIVDDEAGLFQVKAGPVEFLESEPECGAIESWKVMPVEIGVEHQGRQPEAVRDGTSWYRVGNLVVIITKFFVRHREFTASVFDAG